MPQQGTIESTATSIYESNGFTVVRYHQTPVVRFNSMKVELNSGGWKTSTTKTRMNQASSQFNLGFRVFQKDFGWFVDLPNGEGVVDFKDGMSFVPYYR